MTLTIHPADFLRLRRSQQDALIEVAIDLHQFGVSNELRYLQYHPEHANAAQVPASTAFDNVERPAYPAPTNFFQLAKEILGHGPTDA